MNREASPKVTAYAALGGLALIAALVTRRPELAALGAPFLLAARRRACSAPPTPSSAPRCASTATA